MIINKGIVQGSVKPPEWDLDSSEVTVYHRTNIKEVQTEYGTIWEYNEEQMNFKDYALYTQKMIKDRDSLITDISEAIINIQYEQETAKLNI